MSTTMSKTKTSRWLGYDEAATYLDVSKRQLQRWVQQRRIDYTRLGNATLFSPEMLDAFVAKCTVKAVSS